MESLAWIVLLALLLAAVHVVVAVYLYRTAGTDGATFDAGGPVDRPAVGADPAVEPGDEGITCPSCGVPNDPHFRFCRRCVTDLSSGGPVAGGPESTERLGS